MKDRPALTNLIKKLLCKGLSDSEVMRIGNISLDDFTSWKKANPQLYANFKSMSDSLSLFGFEDIPLPEVTTILSDDIPADKVELIDHICQGIKRGLPIPQAVNFAGTTIEELQPLLYECEAARKAINRAQAESIAWWVDKVKEKARAGTWQAATWFLERAYPAMFGQTTAKVERRNVDQVSTKQEAESTKDSTESNLNKDYLVRVGKDGTIISGELGDEQFKNLLDGV